MPVCDSHGAAGWGTPSNISNGEGYLIAARFIQNSIIQEMNIDKGMKMMGGTTMSREKYKLEIESMQGASPWIICEQCINLLNLSQGEKDAARKAAKKWWKNHNTPGHMPRKKTSKIEKKPAYFMIFGKGFKPNENQANLLIHTWLEKRKAVLGDDAAINVRIELIHQPSSLREEFIKIISGVREKHSNQVVDDLIMLDQKSGNDMLLLAVWPPEDTEYIKELLKLGIGQKEIKYDVESSQIVNEKIDTDFSNNKSSEHTYKDSICGNCNKIIKFYDKKFFCKSCDKYFCMRCKRPGLTCPICRGAFG